MSREELVGKCAANIAYGGFSTRIADTITAFADALGDTSTSDSVDVALAKALAAS
ncbi:MAG: hypothetical protein GWN29_10125 [Gammaproteobacteria bacterium]|nr:hypothetical protein [Gammaproteobacteria bacterium]